MKPKMVFFDYGNTLIYEEVNTGKEALRGVYKSIVNGETIDFEDFCDAFYREKREFMKTHHPYDKEFKYTDVLESLFIKLNGEARISYEEISEIYFDDYAPGFAMKGAGDLLDFLESENIAHGVISNLSWSSEILKRRLEKTLQRKMGPVLTTADYIYRKPHAKIFEIAADLAGYKAEEIWYVGDNPLCDVYGSKKAGMTPVYFKAKTENIFMKDHEDIEMDFDYIEIDHLTELIDIIKERG